MEEVEKWWKKAKEDLETAEYNLKGNMLDAAAFFRSASCREGIKVVAN